MSAAIAAPALTSVLEAIGHTPLVRLHLAGIPNAVQLWAKCEWLNPGGSVKDRTARSLIVEGERRARAPGDDATRHPANTAVGLALVGRARATRSSW
jgi:cysteine synthase